ncbi:Purine nucleoside phosphorylase 1 [Fundidesulfovibrio magnetotacticus]|uniref:Purine nucleoside phosphorylase n=1 Tax=Fundidesulfovibrio magnetotacticus TaxID=2730080 RepID=A0A6V8LYM8_9BACT|nr:purine-nucleoside phosphorylase [Fundidesulfovibrio magnetotacticus]GFK95691.1 Purine nucleoside phosphorylase 1 [Fundidesulfovibrio magnetotacticus]
MQERDTAQERTTAENAAAFLRARLPEGFRPRAALVLGTGLGRAAPSLEILDRLDYRDIPGFPRSTVPGHAGQLLAARLAGTRVLVWSGRFHLYEGYTPAQVCLGVRVSALLGAGVLVAANAAGSLNPLHKIKELLVISDHVNLTGLSPLTGPNVDAWGPRFPDMSRAYSARLAEAAGRAALRLGLRLERGVYAGVVGPQLETPAETRMLRLLGADAVGMSTVQEVIAARHMGLEVLGLSCLVNQNLPDCMAEVTLECVLDAASEACVKLWRLLEAVAPEL